MNDETTATAHVNPPQQARSRRTLERIVRAALALLDEEGPDGLTVQAVVAHAESSIGSFYARFKGKEELLEYLEERVWDEARERWQAQLAERDWSSLSLEEVARGSARLLDDAHRSRATFLKSLDRMGAGGGEGYASFRRFVLQALAELLLERRDRIRHEDPDIAVRLALAALSGVIETGDPETGEPFTQDVMVREGSTLVLTYLTGETVAVEAQDRMADSPAAARATPRPEAFPRADEKGEAEPPAERFEHPAERSDAVAADEAPEPAVATAGQRVEDNIDAPKDSVPIDRADGDEDDQAEDEEDVDFFDVWG